MITVKGKRSEGIVYADLVEDEAIQQIERLCDQDFTQGSTIRVMPDVHVGAGCTIGFTMTITDKVVPNLVGVDIGCGMETIQLKNKHLELQRLDKLIYEKIPSGMNIRKSKHPMMEQIDLRELRCREDARLNLKRAELSLGTLGGGNHFIEAGKDEEGNLYITIHSGSRNLGLQVAKYYQELAYQRLNKNSSEDIRAKIEELKRSGREQDIETEIQKMKAQNLTDIPKDLAYLEGQDMENYLHDMKIMQEFARLNRIAMMDEIIRGMKLKVRDRFTTIHNYIDTENQILRKGAVSAQAGEKLLIPINMRDGALICIGKGNEEWNFSAPHGAGRLKSRKGAKEAFTVSEFKKQMEGIYTTSVNQDTLDECPMAYKPIEAITEHIGETVEIIDRIIPIYNFKAKE
ncbi:MAG: RtcB family protein [Peptostreptococcaceae bacterium]|nr:RtcB family protein [Peptostreptococcaceae bacterium]